MQSTALLDLLSDAKKKREMYTALKPFKTDDGDGFSFKQHCGLWKRGEGTFFIHASSFPFISFRPIFHFPLSLLFPFNSLSPHSCFPSIVPVSCSSCRLQLYFPLLFPSLHPFFTLSSLLLFHLSLIPLLLNFVPLDHSIKTSVFTPSFNTSLPLPLLLTFIPSLLIPCFSSLLPSIHRGAERLIEKPHRRIRER